MFDTIRKSDVPKLKCSLFLVGSIIFLQLVVIVSNLNDFNIATTVVFVCIFIIYFVGILSDIIFYHSYYLEINYAGIYVEMHNFTNNFLMILFTLGVTYELLYLEQRLLLYSFYVHLMCYVVYRRLNIYKYNKSVYSSQNNKTHQVSV